MDWEKDIVIEESDEMMKWGRGWERKEGGAIQRKTSGMGREGGGWRTTH